MEFRNPGPEGTSVFFVTYSRMRPFVFSFPRSHGECGWMKYGGQRADRFLPEVYPELLRLAAGHDRVASAPDSRRTCRNALVQAVGLRQPGEFRTPQVRILMSATARRTIPRLPRACHYAQPFGILGKKPCGAAGHRPAAAAAARLERRSWPADDAGRQHRATAQGDSTGETSRGPSMHHRPAPWQRFHLRSLPQVHGSFRPRRASAFAYNGISSAGGRFARSSPAMISIGLRTWWKNAL